MRTILVRPKLRPTRDRRMRNAGVSLTRQVTQVTTRGRRMRNAAVSPTRQVTGVTTHGRRMRNAAVSLTRQVTGVTGFFQSSSQSRLRGASGAGSREWGYDARQLLCV